MNEVKTQATLHLIADESLGGLLREYTETDRKASVGDYVVIKGNDNELSALSEHLDTLIGNVYKTIVSPSDSELIITDGKWADDSPLNVIKSEYSTLSPTDTIHVDGERFRMVDRNAEVGDKVVSLCDRHDTHSGGIYVIESLDAVGDPHYIDDVGHSWHMIGNHQYRVLEPVKPAPEQTPLVELTTANASEQVIATVDETEASPSVIEMLANLSQRIVALEKQRDDYGERIVALEAENKRQNDELDTLHRNNVRLGEELERYRAEAKAPATAEVDAVDFSGFVDAVAAKVASRIADRIAKGLSR